jgi:phosphate-selective porin OprO/OprP
VGQQSMTAIQANARAPLRPRGALGSQASDRRWWDGLAMVALLGIMWTVPGRAEEATSPAQPTPQAHSVKAAPPAESKAAAPRRAKQQQADDKKTGGIRTTGAAKGGAGADTRAPPPDATTAPPPAPEAPGGDSPADGKPADDNRAGDKPADDKPADDKPADDKPTDGKPADDNRAGDKPADDKPADDKPADDKPADDKPGSHAAAAPTAPAAAPSKSLEVLPGAMARGIGKVDGRPIWLGTPDRQFIFRFSGFVHLDQRFPTSIGPDGPESEFINLVRRARFAGEGTVFGQLDYRVMFDPAVELLPLDAYLDWRALPEINLRVGRFKSPFGFERRARAFSLVFNERGYPNTLAPNRDIGVFLHGQTRDGFFSYDVALLSGGANLESITTIRDTPDGAGRIYFQPFRLTDAVPVLREFGVGLSGTFGYEYGAPDDPRLGRIATSVRSVFFQYLPDLTHADGERIRWSVHGHWRHERFNTMWEYAWVGQRMSAGDQSAFIAHHAWQAYGGMTLTDDEWGFFGINPKKPFNPLRNEWGALALAVRYTGIELDDGVFPHFADRAVAVSQAHSASTSFQWVLNQNLGFQVDLESVFFVDGAPGSANRPTEVSLMSRLQAFY